jgi:hypothetical protein
MSEVPRNPLGNCPMDCTEVLRNPFGSCATDCREPYKLVCSTISVWLWNLLWTTMSLFLCCEQSVGQLPNGFLVPGSSELRNSAAMPIRLAPTRTHFNHSSCTSSLPDPEYEGYTVESIRWEAAQQIVHGLSFRGH